MNGTRDCAAGNCSTDGKLLRGLCRDHYDRARRRGQLAQFPLREPVPLQTRLAAAYVTRPSGCREWTRGTNKQGYGEIRVNGRMRRAHRVVWEMGHGPIPEGLFVLHRCDNPPCGNLDHLFLGTNADNMADMARKGRTGSGRKTHCLRGHAFTDENTYMTPTGKRQCRACRSARSARAKEVRP